eukprot:g33365.t1
MPADRRALRQSLKRLRERHILVGFDFDCTLSVRHFYKVFAWCYPQGAQNHAHYQAFSDFCTARELSPKLEMLPRGQQLDMDAILNEFCRQSGEEVLYELLREVFFGGPERINLIASWLHPEHLD